MRVSVPGVGRPRSKVDLSFEGRPVEAWSGDTLAAALVASGELGLRETIDSGRRGVFCGMGACHECSVVIDGRPGKLACMTGIDSGSVIEPQPALSPAPPPSRGDRPKQEIAPTVLVVGGGPAGLSAAAVIAECGVDVVLLDERSKPGGQFYKQPSPDRPIDDSDLDSQFRAGRALIDRARKAGVRFLNKATIWGAFSPDRLTAHGQSHDWILRPSRLILATGAYERSVPIPGWTLPGVMMTGAAQTLLRSGSVSPGRRVMLSGNGPLNMQVAAELVQAGVEVVALAEQADLRWWRNLGTGAGMLANAPELVAKGFSYRTALARAGVPVLDRSSIIEIRGEEQVEEVVVARLKASGHPQDGTEREFKVDAVCLGYGFVPANEISRALGCDHRFDQESGSLVTVRSATGRTSINTVWVVGDAGRISGAYTAGALGILAGAEVVADLGYEPSESLTKQMSRSRRTLHRHRRFQDYLRSLYRTRPLTTQLAHNSTLVCRCESVSLGELREAFADGARSAGAVKRLTRAGMGMCQGRYCSPSVLSLAAERTDTPLGEYSGFAPQTPLRPVTIADLIGNDP